MEKKTLLIDDFDTSISDRIEFISDANSDEYELNILVMSWDEENSLYFGSISLEKDDGVISNELCSITSDFKTTLKYLNDNLSGYINSSRYENNFYIDISEDQFLNLISKELENGKK